MGLRVRCLRFSGFRVQSLGFRVEGWELLLTRYRILKGSGKDSDCFPTVTLNPKPTSCGFRV